MFGYTRTSRGLRLHPQALGPCETAGRDGSRAALKPSREIAVAFPPKRDIRGLRTPAEGMSVARMVVIRCFGVLAAESADLRLLVMCVTRERFRSLIEEAI